MANHKTTIPAGAVFDPQRGLVFTEPPQRVDDLTRIRGLGASMQNTLNANGVYQYEQIAAWTPKNVAAYATILSCFRDRIERNYWIWQAQKLADERASENGILLKPARKPSTFPASIMRTVVVLSLTLLLAAFLVNWLQLRADSEFVGNVYAQVSLIKATRDAHLTELLVRKGDVIKEHQDVLVLLDESGNQQVSKLQSDVEKLKVKLDEAIARADIDYKSELREIDQQILQARLLAERQVQPEMYAGLEDSDRMKSVSHRRFTADADRERKVRIERENYKPLIFFRPDNNGDDDVKAVVVELPAPPEEEIPEPVAAPDTTHRDLCEKRIAELEEMKSALRRDVHEASGVRVAEMQYHHALDKLDELQKQSFEYVVRSARQGRVTRVLRTPGSQVLAGEPVLQLINNNRRHIVASIPAENIGRFSAGREVTVIFAGNQKRHGVVQDLSLDSAVTDPSGESLIPVTILPKGRLWPASPVGATVKIVVR